MSIQVKICGINSVESADAAARAGADFAGLILQKASHRYVGLERSAAIARHLRGRIRITALLVDASDDEVAAVARDIAPDFLQLHGRETPARVSEIVSRFRIPAIKAFGIAEAADLANVSAYDDVAEMFLFDAKPPAGAVTPGGHGVAFDWQILRNSHFARPWLLAGGLNPENVARAISISGAPGVDVSSGVEIAPGQKSAELIRAFVEGVRTATVASSQS
ncbi:MAG TPA: phosphoribosylanthranilate isomerase [Rhizomicrobium sp.]|nr:phosphoribosylanthranilate isomerase [Rhizomicrobium sp.]